MLVLNQGGATLILNFRKKRKAFTLIELIMVIAIIGILAALIIISLRGANDKAKDASRKSEVASISKALEMYKVDNNSYPTSAIQPVSNALRSILSPNYLTTIPTDRYGAGYYYSSVDGSDYSVSFGELSSSSVYSKKSSGVTEIAVGNKTVPIWTSNMLAIFKESVFDSTIKVYHPQVFPGNIDNSYSDSYYTTTPPTQTSINTGNTIFTYQGGNYISYFATNVFGNTPTINSNNITYSSYSGNWGWSSTKCTNFTNNVGSAYISTTGRRVNFRLDTVAQPSTGLGQILLEYSTDNATWNGFAIDQGDSLSGNYYYASLELPPGDYYFRTRAIDFNGSVTKPAYSCVSNKITVSEIANGNNPTITGAPTLTTNNITMPSATFDNGTALGSYTLSISDTNRNMFFAMSNIVPSIASPLDVSVAGLDPGSNYIVDIVVYDQRGHYTTGSWTIRAQ